jgi:uncharacterized protein YkwD
MSLNISEKKYFIINLLGLLLYLNTSAQLTAYKVLPDKIIKEYQTKYGGYVIMTTYIDEFGGSSGIILNKGATYKQVKLSLRLCNLIANDIFYTTNDIRTKAGLPKLIRRKQLDEIAQKETNNKLANAQKFHHTFSPEEYQEPNDSFPNGQSGIGNYQFKSGNNSSVIEIDRKMLKQMEKFIKKGRPADIRNISSKIVEDLWSNSKEHRQNLMNTNTISGVAITAANYTFNDYYIDGMGKKVLLNMRHTKRLPLGTLLFVTQIFSNQELP